MKRLSDPLKKVLCVVFLLFAFSGCIVTGTVTSETGDPMEGVTIRLTGDANAVTTTNSDGVFEFQVPNKAGDYTVTPSYDEFYFAPSSRRAEFSVTTGNSIEGVDFTGIRIDYILCGQLTVTGTDEPIAGATLELSGNKNATAVTNDEGMYELYIPKEYATYTITPVYSRYVFTPEHLNVVIDSSTTIINDRIEGNDFEGEYILDPEFSDITYYHNCDNLGPATIHSGANGFFSNFEVSDENPVNGSPYWKKNGNLALELRYTLETYADNFSIREGRIGFYHFYDYNTTDPQNVIRDPLAGVYNDSLRFKVVIDNGALLVTYHNNSRTINGVIPDKAWYFFEMKFYNDMMTLYIDGEYIGGVAAGSQYAYPDYALMFGQGEDGIMAYDQILASDDPNRSLYDIRDMTEF